MIPTVLGPTMTATAPKSTRGRHHGMVERSEVVRTGEALVLIAYKARSPPIR